MRSYPIGLLWRFAFVLLGRVIPWSALPRLSVVLATVLSPLRYRRKIAHANIRRAIGCSAEEAADLERRAFRNLIRVYLEMPLLYSMTPEKLDRRLTVENPEVLRDRGIEQNGALLLSGHVGNWELLALGAARQAGRSFLIPAKDQRDFGYMKRLRERFGNRTVDLSGGSTRTVLQTISNGGVVALLADQSPGPEDPIINFFGIPTRFFRGPAHMALRYRPEVIVGLARRNKSGEYSVRLQKINYTDLKGPEGEREFLQRYGLILEEAIRSDPASWVWHHRRWKHSPGVAYE